MLLALGKTSEHQAAVGGLELYETQLAVMMEILHRLPRPNVNSPSWS